MTTKCDRGIVSIREERILDDDTCWSTCSENLDEVLEKEKCRLACLDREVLLDLRADLPTKWRIGKDDIVAILLIDIVDILRERIGMTDIGCFDSMEDHIHRGDDVGKRLDLSSIECLLLEDIIICYRTIRVSGIEISECLTEESCRTTRTIIDRLSDMRIEHLHDGTDKWARSIVLTAIASCIPHLLYTSLIEVRELVLLLTRLKVKRIYECEDLTKIVATGDTIFELREYLSDLVLDGLRVLGIMTEVLEIRKESRIHEVDEILSDKSDMMIDLPILSLRYCPSIPLELWSDEWTVFSTREDRDITTIPFEIIKILQEEDPWGLLDIVECTPTSSIFVEDIIDIFEGLFEHEYIVYNCLLILYRLWFSPSPHKKKGVRINNLLKSSQESLSYPSHLHPAVWQKQF